MPLLVREGRPEEVLPTLLHETGAQLLSFNEDTTPFACRRDAAVRAGRRAKRRRGLDALGPGRVPSRARSDRRPAGPTSVYSPYRKTWWQRSADEEPRLPVERLGRLPPPIPGFSADRIPDLRAHFGIELGACDLPTGGEEAAQAAARPLPGHRSRALSRGSRPTRPRWHVAPLAVPPLRGDLGAPVLRARRGGGRSCGAQVAARGREMARRAGLARVLRRHPGGAPAGTARELPAGVRCPGLERRSGGLRGLVRGADGIPDRRCRDAPAPRDRLDAQPGAHDRGELPDERPPDRLARRGALLLRAPGRRRPRLQQRRLAVGRLHRNRRAAVLPDFQSRCAGQALGPGGRLCPSLGSRAACRFRCAGAGAVGVRAATRLPAARRRPRRAAHARPRALSKRARECGADVSAMPSTEGPRRSAASPSRSTRAARAPTALSVSV